MEISTFSIQLAFQITFLGRFPELELLDQKVWIACMIWLCPLKIVYLLVLFLEKT